MDLYSTTLGLALVAAIAALAMARRGRYRRAAGGLGVVALLLVCISGLSHRIMDHAQGSALEPIAFLGEHPALFVIAVAAVAGVVLARRGRAETEGIVTATVVGIFSTSTAGASLHAVSEAELEAGKGLVGDRYYMGVGTFSARLKGKPDSEITLIESEEIQRFNDAENLSAAPGEFRRNIVTRGVRLNDLVGRRFKVGAAELEGMRLCEPCAHLAKLIRPSVLRGMEHRAGLRARIVTGAIVRPGDRIEVG